MDALVDVNVLFALVNERHVFHQTVCSWLDAQESGFRMGICRQVQMTLIRLLANNAAMDNDPLTLSEAWKVYASLIQDPAIYYFPEPAGFQSCWIKFCQPYGASPKVLTDAYLAALAVTAGLPLATLDSDFRNFPGLSAVEIDKE